MPITRCLKHRPGSQEQQCLDAASNLRRAKKLRQDTVLSERDLEIAETKCT